jgi:hypothetical protein
MSNTAARLGWLAAIIMTISTIVYKDKADELQNRSDYCFDEVVEMQENIDDLNYQIEDANRWAWSSYDEMGMALENLYPVYSY